MTPEIREGDRTAAFDAALVAYRPDSHYVPPLWSDFVRFREELLHHRRPRRYALFSALRDGRPVGRIAASIHDDSNRKHGTYNGAFGFFDCIDDADVADALLGKAEGWQPIKRSGFKVRLEDARIILNDGFADNPMFVPPTAAEYLFQAGDMMWIIDKRISTVVYHRGRPAGAIIAIPDLNPLVKSSGGKVGLIAPLRFLQHRTRNNRAVLIYQSVCRELHNRGLNGAMLYRTAQALKQAGYRTLGGTWIADVNGRSLRQAEKVGAKPLHRLHLFTKELSKKLSKELTPA